MNVGAGLAGRVGRSPMPLAAERGRLKQRLEEDVYFCSELGVGAAGGAFPLGGVPPSTLPSGSVTFTKIPPGSPFLNGRAVNLILSPGLTLVDFQPARTR